MADYYVRWPSQGSGGGSGTVTSVALADGSSIPIYTISGSPVVGAGTLTFTLNTETANKVFAGPTSGGAAQPSFRSLVAADLPSGNLTDAGTDGITITGGTNAVIGAGTSISQHVADSTHNGYLSSVDWNTFNGKQASGNYITALTGDVTASGPGSVAATLSTIVNKRYVDFLNGNDSGTGTIVQPWKTLQHAYNSVSPSINEPYVFFLSGGNNDTDSAITAKPNVSLTADYPIQITPAFTISGGSTNDGCTFNNVTFVGAFAWIRNDNTAIAVSFNNCAFFSGPTLRQEGAGTCGAQCTNSTFVNSEWQLTNGGFGVFVGCNFLGTTTFDDPGASGISFLQFDGGYSDGAMTITGLYNPVYFTGFVHDVAFGASVAFVSGAGGFAAVEMDSNGLPATYTGTPSSVTLLSKTNYLDASGLASGSVVFSNGSLLSQDNSNLFWDNTNKRLGIGTNTPSVPVDVIGPIKATNTLPSDSGGIGAQFSVTSHTTTDGSNTTVGVQGVATGVVDVGTTNDKAVGGLVYTTTRGNGSDDGTLSALSGVQSLMFHNSGGAGITTEADGVLSLTFLQNGTITNGYDFHAVTIPAGSGVITNPYGVYIEPYPGGDKQNWLSGKVRLGGSSFSAATETVEVPGTIGLLGSTSGKFVQAAADVTTDYSIKWPAAQGSANDVLTNDGSGNLSWTPAGGAPAAPTLQIFLSGSGTYTTPANVLYLKIRMVGGGGGGSGGGNVTGGPSGSDGTAGTDSSFGTALLVASAGGPGLAGTSGGAGTGGVGGTASLGAASGFILSGGNGESSSFNQGTGKAAGGFGGMNPFGGAGPGGGGWVEHTGYQGVDNTGAGGGGGSSGSGGGNNTPGSGGGAGGYLEAFIPTPGATYSYAVGAGGSGGGTTATGAFPGANGGSGMIIVEEYYQ